MNEIIAAIASQGVGTVLLGIVFWLIIRYYSDQTEKNKKEAEDRREAEREERSRERDKEMFSQMRDFLMTSYHQPQHTVQEENEVRHLNEFITAQLDCLVKEGASRAYFFRLHNGIVDMCGRGFLKMSLTEESIQADCIPIMSRYQNLPRSLFPILYKKLNEEEFYNVYNIEDIKFSDAMTYQFLKEHNVKSALFRSVKRQDGLLIGFIGMEYVGECCVDLEKAEKNIDKKTNRITGALFNQKDVNIN